MGTKQLSKSDLVYKIIRESWGFKTAEDEVALGEIDIQLHAEHISLLENHSKSTR